MTVITAMRFNPEQGAMVADERSSSTRGRQYDIATKLQSFPKKDETMCVVGGSGVADMLYMILDRAKRCEAESAEDQLRQIARITNEVKWEYLDSHMKSSYNVSADEFLGGFKQWSDGARQPLDPDIKQKLHQFLISSNNPNILNAYLALSFEDEIKIHSIDMDRPVSMLCSRPYAVIGSGEIADAELSDFFKYIPREERDNINPTIGLYNLLLAVDSACDKNVGVGGVPVINIMHRNELIIPTENNSHLATEIAKATRRGFLSQEFADESLLSLLYRHEDCESIDKEMYKATKEPDRLNRFLRGYKPISGDSP